MFTNCGNKIRTVAIAFFWITVVASVILAFSLGWMSGRYGDFRPGLFYGFLVGVPALSYISTLFLVAFGDLIENVHNTREDMYDIKKTIEKMSRKESK